MCEFADDYFWEFQNDFIVEIWVGELQIPYGYKKVDKIQVLAI